MSSHHETEPVLIYDGGVDSVLIVHPDPEMPVFHVGPPFEDGALHEDLLVLWNGGILDFTDTIRERGGEVNRPGGKMSTVDKDLRSWRPSDDKTPIARWTPDGLQFVGVPAVIQHYAGWSNPAVQSKLPADLVSLSDMAKRVGIGPSTFSNWCYGPDFPEPRLVRPRRWHWPEVVAWLVQHPNLRGVQLWIDTTYGSTDG